MAKILLVEDENIINMVTQDRLEGIGHTVCGTVGSGREAIERAGTTQPDVIIMDIALKGKMDGIEAARRIKDEFGIPVIYLTAYDDPETRKRAEATDPAAYLVKIFEDVDLQSAIDKALRKKATRPLQEPGTAMQGSLEARPMYSISDDTVRATALPETRQ